VALLPQPGWRVSGVPGPDANPYLVMCWILGGILKGLNERHLPRPPLEGNAYHKDSLGEALPRYWPTALDRFEGSTFARALLGADLHRLYSLVKRQELDDFNAQVTTQEFALYLPAL
jgi:glutamine synthetase